MRKPWKRDAGGLRRGERHRKSQAHRPVPTPHPAWLPLIGTTIESKTPMQSVIVIAAFVSYLPHALAPGAWSVLPGIPVSGEIQGSMSEIGDSDASEENPETTDESGCDAQQMPVFPPVATGGGVVLPHITYMPRVLKSWSVSAKATLFVAKGYGYDAIDGTSVLVTRALTSVAFPIKSNAPPFFATHCC